MPLDLQDQLERDASQMPIVTVFGAGIAGLTAAHELVERGFIVRVVERDADPDQEYACQTGGLAANQLGRIPADVARVHPYLFPRPPAFPDHEDPDGDERCVWLWLAPFNGNEVLRLQIDGEEFDVDTSTITAPSAVAVAKAIAAIAPKNKGFAVDQPDPGKAELKVRSDPVGDRPRVRVRQVNGAPSTLVFWESAELLGDLRRGSRMRPVQPRFPLPQQLRFPRSFVSGDWLPEQDERGITNLQKVDRIWASLKDAYSVYSEDLERWTTLKGKPLACRAKRREELLVEIRGYTDADGVPEGNRARSLEWARLVRSELVQRNTNEGRPIPELEPRLIVIGCGGSAPLGDPLREADRKRSNRVELRIVENVIPGEHGYRFFPRFYRHLFDTMKRTPLFAADGSVTHETTFDQLVCTDHVDVSVEGYGKPGRPAPKSIPARRPRSLEELRELIEIHLDKAKLGLTQRDLLRFQLRILQFLTSSNRRRERVYAEQSWWQFLRGDVPPGYSPNMQRLLREMPQALVAMNADETDAFSQGLIFCQLLMDGLLDHAETNYTLNGPTSAAWMQHWKRYLKRQGVRFYCGELAKLSERGGELRPDVTVDEATCGEVLLQLLSPQSVTLEVQAMSASAAGNTFADVIQQLRQLFSNEPEYGVRLVSSSEMERQGRFQLRSRYERGERLVRLSDRTGTFGDLRINGVAQPAPRFQDPPVEVLLQGTLAGISLTRVGSRGVIVSTHPSATVVSILSADAGEYGVMIGGSRIHCSSNGARSVETIRNELLTAISSAHHTASALGTTGILLPQVPPVDVSAWHGRVGLGPDVVPDRTNGQLVLDAWNVSVSVTSGPLGVVNAVEESPTLAGTTCSLDFDDSDFYVMALPLEAASNLIWPAGPTTSPSDCFGQLLEFERQTGRRDGSGNPLELVRDAFGRPQPSWPLRDLSGIQYYFENHVRVGKGHSYFHGAPWGLSSISQLSYWRERMAQQSPFLGQLSVDIGSWYAPGLAASTQTAWRSSRQAIAEEVWKQIKAGLEELEANHLVAPCWYHLDRGIRFEPTDDGCLRGQPVSWTEKSAGQPCDVTLDGNTISRASLAHLESALHAEGYAADVVDSGTRLVAAPRAQRVASVTLRVLEQSAGIRYRVVVGGGLAEVTFNGGISVRDALVTRINATAIGALASPAADANELRIQLGAPTTTVSALAATPSGAVVPNALALEPGGVFAVGDSTTLDQVAPTDCTASRNDTMFLINNPKLWQFRPGLVPWLFETKILYKLARKRWVLAGNLPATHTRLATMESANESARHAVIAILHAIVTREADADCPGFGTLLGSFPEIWDPAEHELDDADPLKRLDERLHDAGLPHFFEILELDKWVEGLPNDLVPADLAENLGPLVTHAIDTAKEDWKSTGLDELIEAARSSVKKLLGV